MNIISRSEVTEPIGGSFPIQYVTKWKFEISLQDSQLIVFNPYSLYLSTPSVTSLVNDIYPSLTYPSAYGSVWYVEASSGTYFLILEKYATIPFFASTSINDVSFSFSVTIPNPFITNPFSSGKYYCTKGSELIVMNSATDDTYVVLTATINTYSYVDFNVFTYSREFKIPLFNRTADFHIGTIVHQLLEEVQSLNEIVSSNGNYQASYVKPATVHIYIEEFKFDGSASLYLQNETLPLFYMIKGFPKLQTPSGLMLLSTQQQSISRITCNSKIGLSFIHFQTPTLILKKNDIVIDNITLTVNPNSNKVYSYFWNNIDLKIGDILEIIVVYSGQEFLVSRYLVYPEGLNSYHLFYENDNGVIEPFEFTGRFFGSLSYKNKNKNYLKNLKSIESKEISENNQVITINPGKIEKSDLQIIDKIIHSKNVWINLEGELIKIDCTNQKLPLWDSESNEIGSNLEFNVLENTDDKIYI